MATVVKPRLILLSGYGRAGKDSVRKILEVHHGFSGGAFADCVRELALELDPLLEAMGGFMRYRIMLEHFGYETAKSMFPSVREFLVKLGHGARKVLGEDVWRRPMLAASSKARAAGIHFCISDARYADEANIEGAKVWYIERPGVGPANETEAATVPKLRRDLVIMNDGTLHDLEKRVLESLTMKQTK